MFSNAAVAVVAVIAFIGVFVVIASLAPFLTVYIYVWEWCA